MFFSDKRSRVAWTFLAAALWFVICGRSNGQTSGGYIKAAGGNEPGEAGQYQQSDPESRCRLRYEFCKGPESIVRLACQSVSTGAQKPSLLDMLPVDAPDNALYFTVNLWDKKISGLTYRSMRGLGKPKLFLDFGGDGRLSDDKCYPARLARRPGFGLSWFFRFGPIHAKPADAAERESARFCVDTIDGQVLTFYPAGYRSGRVRLGNRVCQAAAVDGTFDGRYDKIVSLPVKNLRSPNCDLFGLDLDQSGRIDSEAPERLDAELMPLCRMVRVGDLYYSIEISADGTELELKETRPELGTLDVGGGHVNLKLWSDTAHQHLVGAPAQWQIPAGKYQTVEFELYQTDAGRNRWTYKAVSDYGQLASFEISPGGNHQVKAGPPFVVSTDISRSENVVSIGIKIAGQAGEQYSPKVLCNGRELPVPRIEIADDTGRVLVADRFKYG